MKTQDKQGYLAYRNPFKINLYFKLSCSICYLPILLIIFICPGEIYANSNETIKIGGLFSLTGSGSPLGIAQKAGAQLAVKEINIKGGIEGHSIELIIRDTKSKSELAVKYFKEIINRYKVVAFIGISSTSNGMALKKLIEENKIPTVMMVGGDSVILSGRKGTKIYGSADWIFKTPHRSSSVVKKLYQYLKEINIRNIDLLTSTDKFGIDGKRWLAFFSTKYGIINVNDEHFQQTTVDFEKQLKKVEKSRSEGIVCWTVGRPAALIVKQRSELKIKKPFFFNHGLSSSEFIEDAGESSEGIYMVSPKLCIVDQLSDEDPQKEVINKFIEKFKDEYKMNKEIKLNMHAAHAWDAVQILIKGIKKVGIDRHLLRNEIEGTKKHVGVNGTYNMNPKDHNGLELDSLVVVQIVNSKFVLNDY